MYYKERKIGGIWCYRTSPNQAWREMCKEQLYKKIDRLESTLTERAKDQDKITKALIAANEKNKKQK